MKPKVIVFGGCGFIGRNLVDHLIQDEIASEVCVVDKVPVQTAWLSPTHKKSFDDARVSFKSANLINPDSCRLALARDDGETWDWAVNCAGETRPGQSPAVYEEGVYKLSMNVAKACADARVSSYVEISCCLASNKKVACAEDDIPQPSTQTAKLKARVEEELAQIPGMRKVILRPAIVYGSGDRLGLVPLLVIGAVYKHLGECMKLLWSREVQMNTVHVRDVARAVSHILSSPAPTNASPEVYNLVDDSASTLGSVCDAVAAIFKIETGVWGNAISLFAKTDLETVAEDVNDKHLPPWAMLCSADGVTNTPLSPYVTSETLRKNYVHLDGSKLKKTGFTYSHPKLKVETLREISNTSAVLSKLSALYSERSMCDMTLVVGGVEFPCHRLILASFSDVFHAMLTSQWAESGASSVALVEEGECLENFDDFLRYFYTGSIRLTLPSAIPILILSDKYNVRDLVNHCLDFMGRHLAQAAVSDCLGHWAQYTHFVGHSALAQVCRDFVSWNIPLLNQKYGLVSLDAQSLLSLLKQSNLVVCDEMYLYNTVVQWIQRYEEQSSDCVETSDLVVQLMSHIRFPMMTLKQLAQLLLCPVVRAHKDFFMEKMALGIAFHSGKVADIQRQLHQAGGAIQFTPRLYTDNSHASLLTVENVGSLPWYHTNTLVFTSQISMAEHEGDCSCEWVIDVCPKGVLIKKCFMIRYDGNMEIPEFVLKTVRVSITCKDPPSANSHSPNLRVMIGIVVYGIQDGIECVQTVTQRVHHFSEKNRVTHINDLLPYDSLNPPPGVVHPPPSPYLVGPNRDTLKMHVIIQPIDSIIPVVSP